MDNRDNKNENSSEKYRASISTALDNLHAVVIIPIKPTEQTRRIGRHDVADAKTDHSLTHENILQPITKDRTTLDGQFLFFLLNGGCDGFDRLPIASALHFFSQLVQFAF